MIPTRNVIQKIASQEMCYVCPGAKFLMIRKLDSVNEQVNSVHY